MIAAGDDRPACKPLDLPAERPVLSVVLPTRAIFISISCNRLSFSPLVLATDIILNGCYHGILALDPFSSLQRSVFMSGRAFSYFADTPGLPLSLKCMANGRALYKFGRAEVAVDDGGYLILNDRQPYSIEIASPTPVETFVLWFPDGWAEEVSSASMKRPKLCWQIRLTKMERARRFSNDTRRTTASSRQRSMSCARHLKESTRSKTVGWKKS